MIKSCCATYVLDAKVKHCNEIQKSDATRYGVGIKYIFQY